MPQMSPQMWSILVIMFLVYLIYQLSFVYFMELINKMISKKEIILISSWKW